jgi:hypothetical protein
MAYSFLKKGTKHKPSESQHPVKTHKKASVPSVHYASYMKPTHNVKEKIREILIEER